MSTGVCEYPHHKTKTKAITCKKCKGFLTCGPFGHACAKCQPEEFKPCLRCHARRIDCSC